MRLSIFIIQALFVFFSSISAFAESPLKVVTTLSSYADIAKSIGGELVDVKYVASPKFNPHFIEPRPSDVLRVKNSDLFIHSGLDLEAWRGPLLDAAARADIRQSGERQLDLSLGIKILEVPDHVVSRAEGDIHIFGNPHYWLDPENGKIIANEIASKLAMIDAQHRDEYEKNLATFTNTLDKKIEEWKRELLPYQESEVIGYHNEWLYLMSFSGLSMKYFLEPKPGIPPTPQQAEFIKKYIKEHKIREIVQATFNPSDAGEMVAKETNSKLLVLCQNVGELPQASDYISMIDYNISQIVEAFKNG